MIKATQKSLFEDLKNITLRNKDTEYLFQKEYMRNKILNEEYRSFLMSYNICFRDDDKLVHSSEIDFDYLLEKTKNKIINITSKDDRLLTYSGVESFSKKWFNDVFIDTYTKILFKNLNKIKNKYNNVSDMKIFFYDEQKIFCNNFFHRYIPNAMSFLDIIFNYPKFSQLQSDYNLYVYENKFSSFEDILKIDADSYSPKYNLVIEFDFYNDKKIYFLANTDMSYIKKISNIKDLCFFESIRYLNKKVNQLMYANKTNRRKLIIEDIVKDIFKNELNNNEIDMNFTVKSENPFYITISNGSYYTKGCICLDTNSFILKQNIGKYIKEYSLDRYLDITNILQIPRLYFIYDFAVEDNEIWIKKRISFKTNIQSFDFLATTSLSDMIKNDIMKDGCLERYKSLINKLEEIFSELDKKFNKYNKKISEYLYNIERINELYEKRKIEEKEQNKKIKDDLNNAIKNRKNKSFMDVLTTLVFKNYISNDAISQVIELTNPKEE